MQSDSAPFEIARRDWLKSAALGGALTLLGQGRSHAETKAPGPGKVRGVVFMVSDGMSPGVLTLAQSYSELTRKRPTTWWELFNNPSASRGLMDTASANSMVTDSAAASSAWGGGQRVNNGAINISTKGKPSAIIYTDFKLFPLVVDQVVRLENIFYDYNKADIRPDAAVELDKLVLTLQDNPTVRIELSSHTDCRGKDAYNMSLSQKRAKSAVDYLIAHGIAAGRVVSKGYGESKPSEACACTACSEDEHQRNRRTEFKVLSK